MNKDRSYMEIAESSPALMPSNRHAETQGGRTLPLAPRAPNHIPRGRSRHGPPEVRNATADSLRATMGPPSDDLHHLGSDARPRDGGIGDDEADFGGSTPER